MTKNQLFRKIPPKNVVINILNVFGLKDFDDQRYFSRKDLETLKCVDSMNEKIKPLLSEYYLPCKSRTYLNDLTPKNVITILRQIVRLYDYNVISKEKYIKGDKFIIYQLVANVEKKYRPITIESIQSNKKACTVNFD